MTEIDHASRLAFDTTGGIPTLTGGRLVLRPCTLADAADVQRMAGDRRIAETTLLIPHPYPDGAAEAWISTHAQQYTDGKSANWAITLADTGELVGAIGLVISNDHDNGELGYWVGAAFWNNGYVTEAGRLVLNWAFDVRGLHRVCAHHFASNPASGRVMAKLGMQREGVLREHVYKWGHHLDCVYYGILREEYERSRTREP